MPRSHLITLFFQPPAFIAHTGAVENQVHLHHIRSPVVAWYDPSQILGPQKIVFKGWNFPIKTTSITWVSIGFQQISSKFQDFCPGLPPPKRWGDSKIPVPTSLEDGLPVYRKWSPPFISHGVRPFGRGTSLLRGLTITMVINHLITYWDDPPCIFQRSSH